MHDSDLFFCLVLSTELRFKNSSVHGTVYVTIFIVTSRSQRTVHFTGGLNLKLTNHKINKKIENDRIKEKNLIGMANSCYY